MAYPDSQVVMGGLVHIPIIIGVFWALNNLTTGGSQAKKAAEAAAKQAAESAAAAAATTAVAPVSGEAEASQASNNDTQATPAPDQEVL